jgi:hypothetical protein
LVNNKSTYRENDADFHWHCHSHEIFECIIVKYTSK